ncbi:MAG: hypothetical protein V8R46_07910 [Eubacterium ramulus]
MSQLHDAKDEAAEKFADADAQIADAKTELADSRTEICSGWQQLQDGMNQLQQQKNLAAQKFKMDMLNWRTAAAASIRKTADQCCKRRIKRTYRSADTGF